MFLRSKGLESGHPTNTYSQVLSNLEFPSCKPSSSFSH